MPKMTRAAFVSSIDDMWTLTQDRIATTGIVWSTLIALDPMGRQQIFMELDPETPGMQGSNAVLLGAPFHECVETITEKFRAHGAVAALLYAEAWTVANETYAETVRMNIRVHEHPMKDEIVFAVGFWPREFIAKGHQAFMVRDENGENPRLVDHSQYEDDSATVLVSWLAEALPQPH